MGLFTERDESNMAKLFKDTPPITIEKLSELTGKSVNELKFLLRDMGPKKDPADANRLQDKVIMAIECFHEAIIDTIDEGLDPRRGQIQARGFKNAMGSVIEQVHIGIALKLFNWDVIETVISELNDTEDELEET